MIGESLNEKLNNWWENIKVDGWVELNEDSGNIHIELFPVAIRNLQIRPGDYVRIQVVREEDLE